MHEYLESIGFSGLNTRKQLKSLLSDVQESYDYEEVVSSVNDMDLCEFRKEYGEEIGISIFGGQDEYSEFEREYYVPYFCGRGITSYSDVTVERHMERQMYAGICEDPKIGITLIFHLQNMMEYEKRKSSGTMKKNSTTITLSGLSNGGTILFPIQKTEKEEQEVLEESRNRMMLLSAARNGDQDARETLTMEDMNLYSKVSKRLVKEDVLSLVDTYIMPYGVECDCYSILGIITAIRESRNDLTGEELYIFTLDINELGFDVCIPKRQVFGEPEVGRRFKGNIWLQGEINF